MMPSRKEAIGLWLPLSFLLAIVAVFAVLGMDLAIIRFMTGPVGQMIYGLTTVFTLVFIIDLIPVVIIWIVERALNTVTRQEVQYGPVVPVKATKALPKPQIKSVYELALPLPPPPGKPGFKSRVIRPPSTALPIPVAEIHPVHTSSEDEPIIEKPEVPALDSPQPSGAPALRPGPAVGTNLPVPASPRPTGQPPAAKAPASEPPRPTPLGGMGKTSDKPAEPARPSPFAPKPAASAGSSGNLPALRPTQPPAGPRPTAPTPAQPKSPFASSSAPGKTPFAPLGKPAPKPAAGRPVSEDDVIEGEVVDDDVTYETDPDYAPDDDE
jgi:hypothetical protein